MNPSLGNFYQHVSEQKPMPAQAQIAQGVQGYTPAETDPLAYLAQQQDEEDLPF
jgi:hypothetical protein